MPAPHSAAPEPEATLLRDEEAPAPKRGSVGMVGETRAYWLFLIPASLFILALIVLPLVYAGALSLRDFNLIRRLDEFIGLGNYKTLFTGGDIEFATVLLRTLIYVVIVIGIDFLIGLTQAMLLRTMKPQWARIWRAVFLLPILIIPTASAMFWRMIMHAPPNQQLLKLFGLEGDIPPMLSSPRFAFWGIIITVTWAWSPWVFLLLASGLDSLDESVLEAAEIDGVSSLQRLRYVILPMMKPVIFVTLSFKAVDSFLSFPFVWVMTQGGPGGSTHLLSTYIYERAFQHLDYGFGSALAMVMLVISAVLSIGAVLYWQRSQQHA